MTSLDEGRLSQQRHGDRPSSCKHRLSEIPSLCAASMLNVLCFLMQFAQSESVRLDATRATRSRAEGARVGLLLARAGRRAERSLSWCELVLLLH